ncbi:MAG: xanthine dehydrogenase family protein molybdopterin-binding subunit [Pseudomonadota bacterium]|nr:xanthine dehydrogenase family protein molybdopterin-binding subunit [Pseudomonadota bacterium]
MEKFGVSQPVLRKEDVRLLTGHGRYVDDIAPESAAHAFFLRSPIAHAEFAAPDLSAARAAPGVIGVYAAGDLDGKMKNFVNAGVVKNRDGSNGAAPTRPILATGRVRYVGEAIAIVVAETFAQARDAAELIEIDFDELPAAYSTAGAFEEPEVHPEAPKNQAFDWAFGDEAATKAAFESAAHVVELPLVNNRVIANPIEPRGAWAEWTGERLHISTNGQGVWNLKAEMAKKLGIEADQVRVTNPDVGGGFGMKAFSYPEHFAVGFAARELGRPVRWMSDRAEGMMTDAMGRDHVTTARAAFDKDLKLQAIWFTVIAGLGAYNSPFGQYIPSEVAKNVLPGVYDVQVGLFEVKGAYTNTCPVDSYRGAGRPEAIYQIERLMEFAAVQLGVEPAELRRRNFIPPEKFPYKTLVGQLYDVGNFEKVMDRAMKEADWAGYETRKAASAAKGKLRGRGMATYIESILGAQNETAKIEFAEDGGVNLYVGTQSNGQGHETVYAQILHQRSGLPFDKIRIVQGDSDLIAKGGGTGGSRSVTMQGNAINAASDEMVERFRPLAEEELETAAADIVFADGAFTVAGTDKTVTLEKLAETARARGMVELLVHETENVVPGRSFPNGCHIVELEVDPDTGSLVVDRYTIADDFGLLMNPVLAIGQVHGGVAQGLGQAVTEQVVYDESGQLLTATFMDYAMPRAADMPEMTFFSEPTPSTANAIGMKGCGEAGTVGALAAVTNAALDALKPAGVGHVDMPLTPQRVWSWLAAAKTAAE